MPTTLAISSQLTYARAQGYLPAFTAAANQTGVERNLLLAVASRESGMGLDLDFNFLGDGGNGIGLMQIDRRYHPFYAGQYNPRNNEENVQEGAEILQDELQRYGNNRQYALDAYNAGSGNVDRAVNAGRNPDSATTGGDYGTDVLARYRLLQQLSGGASAPQPGGGLLPLGAPEDKAQNLVLLTGGALVVSLGVTGYIIARKRQT